MKQAGIMIKRLKSTLRKHLIKTQTINSFKIDNITYKIVDRTSFLPSYKNRRDIIFKTDNSNRLYSHSAVYTDTKHVFQPTFVTVQKLIECWNKRCKINNALVLGCAGCTIPRFISLKYPECKTVGIEYEEKFIEIARKHFWIKEFDSNFTIFHDDAFNYVKNTKGEKYDIVFVDIFLENQIPQEVLSNEFLNDINNCSSDNSIIIFNLLEKKVENVIPFAKTLPDVFNEKYVINYDIHCFLVTVKSSDNCKEAFVESLKTIGELNII